MTLDIDIVEQSRARPKRFNNVSHSGGIRIRITESGSMVFEQAFYANTGEDGRSLEYPDVGWFPVSIVQPDFGLVPVSRD